MRPRPPHVPSRYWDPILKLFPANCSPHPTGMRCYSPCTPKLRPDHKQIQRQISSITVDHLHAVCSVIQVIARVEQVPTRGIAVRDGLGVWVGGTGVQGDGEVCAGAVDCQGGGWGSVGVCFFLLIPYRMLAWSRSYAFTLDWMGNAAASPRNGIGITTYVHVKLKVAFAPLIVVRWYVAIISPVRPIH